METSTNNLSTMTPISRDALHLHNDFMLVITMLFIVVFGIMIYTMVKHRRSAGYQPTKFTGPTGTVQWLWAMVPFAILLFIDYALMGLN
jgi:cytochrome c oxidase subunit 2